LHFGAAYPGGVFWVRAYGNDDAKAALGPEQREALRGDQVRQIAERLGIDTHGQTAEQIEGALARKIGREGKPCLWVVDDVPDGLDGEALRRWFAPHPLARTLVTTRSREYGAMALALNLEVLTSDEAHQLVTSQRAPATEAEERQARLLTGDLGCHALALDVTGSALLSYGENEPYRRFREDLVNPDEDVLELAKDLADSLPNGHETSIASTLLRSILRLAFEGRDFLRLASVLAVAPIPASLVKAVFERVDHISHWDAQWRTAQGFRQVTAASLAEIAGEQQEARSVHTLVSRTMRFHEKANPARTQALRAAAVESLRSEIAKAAEDPRLHKQIEFHVSHARQVIAIPESIPEADLVHRVARYDFERGSYASARTLWERELEFNRRVLGPEHPNTLTAMSGLSYALYAQGDLAGARKLLEEVLAIRRRVQGPEHPDALGSMNNLAETLRVQGDFARARNLHEEVLAIQRRVQGPEHPDALGSMNNLALTLYMQGNLAGARKVQEEVLAIQRRVQGPEHPKTLTSMNNLAGTLYTQGDLAGAHKIQEEVLEIRRRVLGREHPDTSIAAWSLCVTLHDLSERGAARAVLERDLRWLLDRDPATLGTLQRKAREYVANVVKKSG